MAKETDGLSEAMRKEKDAKVYKRIMALMFVPEDDMGVPEAARRGSGAVRTPRATGRRSSRRKA